MPHYLVAADGTTIRAYNRTAPDEPAQPGEAWHELPGEPPDVDRAAWRWTGSALALVDFPPAPDSAAFKTALLARFGALRLNALFAKYPLANEALAAGDYATLRLLVDDAAAPADGSPALIDANQHAGVVADAQAAHLPEF